MIESIVMRVIQFLLINHPKSYKLNLKDTTTVRLSPPIFIIYVVAAPLNPHPHSCYAAARSRPAGCSIIMNGHCLVMDAYPFVVLNVCDVTRHLIDIFNNRLMAYILISSLNTSRC